MTAANYGNWTMKIGTNASPQVLTNLEEVQDVDGFGASNDLIEATNWDTTHGEKEFIAGPAEGDEFTATCNHVAGGSTHQNAVREDKGSTRLFEIAYNGVSPQQLFSGEAVLMGWSIDPNQDDVNAVEFKFKITGAITETP